MRRAEARMVADSGFDARFDAEHDAGLDDVMEEFWRLQRTLPLQDYFQALENFIDQARNRLSKINDPAEKNRLQEQYSRVITSAVNMACGIRM